MTKLSYIDIISQGFTYNHENGCFYKKYRLDLSSIWFFKKLNNSSEFLFDHKEEIESLKWSDKEFVYIGFKNPLMKER